MNQRYMVMMSQTLWYKITFLFFTLIILTKIPQTNSTPQNQYYSKTPPPLPLLPLPNFSQLQWQQREVIMFLHFGVNTFTDREWGTGNESLDIFNPTSLDTNQWAQTAVQAGISVMILTAKHHDGFCLWRSRYTDHSVATSRWRSGDSDVVGEFVYNAKRRGVDVGLYLSPWDRHDPRYGHDKAYNEYYLAQLQELLNNYGSVKEIWFDGAKGVDAPNMTYYYNEWFQMVKELQQTINIFSGAGGVRWVGNEQGIAGTTCWSTINQTLLYSGNSPPQYLTTGDSRGTDWLPPECDVSIRPGWFWHKSEQPKTLKQLLDIYYTSVGRNCVLLLNVPPNNKGLISKSDVKRLKEFRNAINTIFSTDMAGSCSIKASSQRGGLKDGFGPENVIDSDHLWTYWAPSEDYKGQHWIELRNLGKMKMMFNVVRIQEAIGLGQRIKQHESYVDGVKVANGTTVGYKKLHRFENGVLEGNIVTIKIIESRATPLISSIGLRLDPF